MIAIKKDPGGVTLEIRGSLQKEIGSFAVYGFVEEDGTTSTLEDLFMRLEGEAFDHGVDFADVQLVLRVARR